MSDFFKRRTTIADRREKVKALEPPTFTICLYPPFKASKYSAYNLFTPHEIFWFDFPNETLGQRFDKVSFHLGTDFHISYVIQLNGESENWVQPYQLLKDDKYFTVLPIKTFWHGTCTKIQPRFTIISERFSLWLNLTLDSGLESIDEPSKFIIYMTSNNTWQSMVNVNFGRSTPSKVELDLRSYNYYMAQTIEYLYDEGLENSEDCWKTHLKNSNCTMCQYYSLANLPMCNTSQEVTCIRNVAFKYNLWRICNVEKNFLSFNGDLTKVSQYNPPGNDTRLDFFISALTKEIKEEIDIITLSDLIGSVGGSLGMFFGFSISASAFYFMEKCILKIKSTQFANFF